MKKRAIILILLLLTIALVSYFVFTQQNESSETAAEQVNMDESTNTQRDALESRGFTEYSNQNYQISFYYPDTWEKELENKIENMECSSGSKNCSYEAILIKDTETNLFLRFIFTTNDHELYPKKFTQEEIETNFKSFTVDGQTLLMPTYPDGFALSNPIFDMTSCGNIHYITENKVYREFRSTSNITYEIHICKHDTSGNSIEISKDEIGLVEEMLKSIKWNE
jgi:hypothetical protein